MHLVCDIQNSYLKKKHLSLGNISTSTLKNRCRQTHTQLNTGDFSQATISHKHPGETTPQYNGIRGGSQKHFFALRASVWSTNKEEGGGHPGPLPWIRHWNKHDSDRSRRQHVDRIKITEPKLTDSRKISKVEASHWRGV